MKVKGKFSLSAFVMFRTMNEGADKVLSKIVRRKPVSTAAALTMKTRSALSAMVEKETRRVGSRAVAYEIVAQTVGASSSWLRKFLAGSNEAKEPRITLFFNIRAAYENMCERVEAENRLDEFRLLALRGDLNAITDGFSDDGTAEISDRDAPHVEVD